MKRVCILLFLIILLTGCAKQSINEAYVFTDDFLKLGDWMTGRFSSYKQSAQDTNYYHIDLIMYPIWSERHDGIWIYVEQALHENNDKPYRQRIYNLKELRDGLYESNVYTIKSEEQFINCYNNSQLLSCLTEDSLILKHGCSIVISRKCQLIFEGNTVGSACKSELYDASYAQSQVIITKQMLKSWDRGFDRNHKHVWGPESGPYIFDKEENFSIYE